MKDNHSVYDSVINVVKATLTSIDDTLRVSFARQKSEISGVLYLFPTALFGRFAPCVAA